MKTFAMSYTRWERVNFYLKPWRIKEKTTLKSFTTNSSIPSDWMCFSFSHIRNSARIIWWSQRTTAGLLRFHKNKHLVHIAFELGISDGNLMFSFMYAHGSRVNPEAYINGLKNVVHLLVERVANRRLYVRQQDCGMPHQENPVFVTRKFLQQRHPHAQDCNTLEV